MLAYATLGTRDLQRAGAFYDALLVELGARRVMDEPGYLIAWGNSRQGAGLCVVNPFDKKPATVGNGTMVALAGASREQATGLDQINTAVGSMDEMTQRNGALVEETTAAAQSLSIQARDLTALVERFRIAA